MDVRRTNCAGNLEHMSRVLLIKFAIQRCEWVRGWRWSETRWSRYAIQVEAGWDAKIDRSGDESAEKEIEEGVRRHVMYASRDLHSNKDDKVMSICNLIVSWKGWRGNKYLSLGMVRWNCMLSNQLLVRKKENEKVSSSESKRKRWGEVNRIYRVE